MQTNTLVKLFERPEHNGKYLCNLIMQELYNVDNLVIQKNYPSVYNSLYQFSHLSGGTT